MKKEGHSQHRGRVVAVLNLVVAVAVLVGLLYVGGWGAGPLPPLGPLLNPGTGAWAMARTATTKSETISLPRLNAPVQVTFDAAGVAHITATTDHDLYVALGYVHASNRLFQMDAMRRQGEGLLSQVIGTATLSSDEFELQLGLTRTARQEWNLLSPTDQADEREYAEGVNALIEQEKRDGTLPVMFKALGYQPTAWTPIDTLVIQGVMTQSLDFSTSPLDYALLVNALGYERTMQYFPVLPQNPQSPYDPGPYKQLGIVPLSTAADTSGLASVTPPEHGSPLTVSDAEAQAASAIRTRIASLPVHAEFTYPDSNNWAVDGTVTASGKPIMAGDPHLEMTLPAIWYQVDLNSPSYHVAGVSIPGTPIVLIGHNQHISWSLTNTQNQATFFYQEQTDSAHPNQYYWNNAWRQMTTISYNIPVKGSADTHLTVKETVHGPIISMDGMAMSVWWAGAQPSLDGSVMTQVEQASDWTAFRDALRNWYAPSQNFVYADDQGNIGLISAGYYPQVASGDPWLPLSGTGASDVIGTIPFDAIPQVFDPPTHFTFSANQREVDNTYPYYIGTTLDFFSDGYRADMIQQTLSAAANSGSASLTAEDMEHLQNSTQDYLAALILPRLRAAFQGQSTSQTEYEALAALAGWNDTMTTGSVAATIWMRFWTQYVYDTFGPWWQAKGVPRKKDDGLLLAPNQVTGMTIILGMNLEAWTVNDPQNAAFTLPDGTQRSADSVMRQAFAEALRALTTHLGSEVSTWTWGRVHFREIASLAGIPALGYGPVPAPGNEWTVNAADGGGNLDAAGDTATAGPSWRLVIDWGVPGGQAYGVYPGGQSENPLSPWYENQIPSYWNGKYYPLLSAQEARAQKGSATWTLTP